MEDRRIFQTTISNTPYAGTDHPVGGTTLLEEYDPYIAGLIRKLQKEVRTERNRFRKSSVGAGS